MFRLSFGHEYLQSSYSKFSSDNPKRISPKSTAYSLTIKSLLSTLYSLLSILYFLLSTLYSLLSTLYSLLSTLLPSSTSPSYSITILPSYPEFTVDARLQQTPSPHRLHLVPLPRPRRRHQRRNRRLYLHQR